jgi:putative spermidine/putrescine transport system permease protein
MTVTASSEVRNETAASFNSDGRAAYDKTRRRASAQALLLALPLLLFLLATFIAPIAILLSRSIDNREVPDNLPALTQALHAWNGEDTPDEHTYAILAAELRRASQDSSEPWRGA